MASKTRTKGSRSSDLSVGDRIFGLTCGSQDADIWLEDKMQCSDLGLTCYQVTRLERWHYPNEKDLDEEIHRQGSGKLDGTSSVVGVFRTLTPAQAIRQAEHFFEDLRSAFSPSPNRYDILITHLRFYRQKNGYTRDVHYVLYAKKNLIGGFCYRSGIVGWDALHEKVITDEKQ